MSQILVDVEELRSVASEIQANSSALNEVLMRLTNRLSNIEASWKGMSSQQFQEAWAQWKSSCEQLHSALETMPTALNTLAGQFQDTDNSLRVS